MQTTIIRCGLAFRQSLWFRSARQRRGIVVFLVPESGAAALAAPGPAHFFRKPGQRGERAIRRPTSRGSRHRIQPADPTRFC
jgi:hypothetical protein